MKRIVWFLAPAVLLGTAAPAVLAGDHGKCSYSTQECLDMMAEKLQHKGWIGVNLDDESGQLKVTKVVADSPAEKAGLEAGDVLFAVNGVEYTEANKEKLEALRSEMNPGKAFTFTVLKAGKDKQDLKLTLATLPEEVKAEWVGTHMLSHATLAQAEKE